VQPWDSVSHLELHPTKPSPDPVMIKAGHVNGKQYGIPDDWCSTRSSSQPKGEAKAKSLGLPCFDERYKGKIAWLTNIDMFEIPACTSE